MLYAIGLQESRFLARRQYNNGPARGFWQFECWGGVQGVLTHPASKAIMEALCNKCGVPPTSVALWNALEKDDELAAATARMLLYTDPHALPGLNDAAGAWAYYIRNWRPGMPHRQTWDGFHAEAVKAVKP